MKNNGTKICGAGLFEFNPYEKNTDNLPTCVAPITYCSGKEGTEIKALINCEVLAWGWYGGLIVNLGTEKDL